MSVATPPLRLQPNHDALFLDIDGTLLDIAPTPEAVIVPDSLKQHLARLYDKLGGALALISGRSIHDIDTLFSPLHLPASGAHGAEWRIQNQKEARELLSGELRQNITKAFATEPKLLVEDKGYSIAVHYRQAPDMGDRVKEHLQQIVAESKKPLLVMPGKMVHEVVCPWHNKGTAIEYFMSHAPFAGRRPVFLGDDDTDMFAMYACRKMGGIAAGVGRPLPDCEIIFASPADVREWITLQ